MHAIFVVQMRIGVVIYEHRKCAHLSAQCALWENFSMIPVRMTVSITWMFVQRTVPTARTWMAAAVGHTRRTLIVRSGRLRNPCWDRKRGPRRGEGGGGFLPRFLFTQINSLPQSQLLGCWVKWAANSSHRRKRHRARCAGEHSHWRPHAFILVTTGKPQHCAHRQPRPVPSRLACPVLSRGWLARCWTEMWNCFMSY